MITIERYGFGSFQVLFSILFFFLSVTLEEPSESSAGGRTKADEENATRGHATATPDATTNDASTGEMSKIERKRERWGLG